MISMTLPPTLDADGLGRLLYLSPATILRDISRRPDSLPPFITIRKKKVWVTLIVIEWMVNQSNRPIDVDLRCLVQSQVAEQKPNIPSLADMLEAANAPTQKKRNKK